MNQALCGSYGSESSTFDDPNPASFWSKLMTMSPSDMTRTASDCSVCTAKRRLEGVKQRWHHTNGNMQRSLAVAVEIWWVHRVHLCMIAYVYIKERPRRCPTLRNTKRCTLHFDGACASSLDRAHRACQRNKLNLLKPN